MSIAVNKNEFPKFDRKSFFFQQILGLTKTDYTEGTYTGQIFINNSGVDKNQLKCDFIDGSIGSGIRQPILYRFAMDGPLGQKLIQRPRPKLKNPLLKKLCFM